jgi:methyl-accepting chemotaxis protein
MNVGNLSVKAKLTAASTEQSRGIEQVSQAITQMDEVTQQNAALVEEAAAASKSLEDQGRQLNKAISLIVLDTGDALLNRGNGNSRRLPAAA